MEDFENFLSKQMFADILYDDIFKMIFTKPENNDLLLALLQNVLPSLDIREVDLVNGEQNSIARHKKRSVFDVYCTTSSGVKIIVEVQHRSIPDYLDRVLYYSSFPILAQHNAGDKNYYLTPVYVVSFINFALGHSGAWSGDNISRYSIREDQSGELMTDNLHFVFVELGRFRKGKSELKTETDWWLYCLKNMKNMDTVPEDLNIDIIQRLFWATNLASMTTEEKEEYYRIMTTQTDIEIWKEEARKEGLAEGRAEGRAEGEAKGKAEVARAMLAKNSPVDFIASVTGLTEAQVRTIAKSL